MTSGLPDYYLGMRPRYGAAQNNSDGKVVTARDTTILVTVSGKGLIYGGNVLLDPAGSQAIDVIRLLIDGQYLSAGSIYSLYLFKFNKPWSSSLYLIHYDNETFKYAVGISPSITFESSFQVEYKECYGNTPTVYHNIDFALIT